MRCRVGGASVGAARLAAPLPGLTGAARLAGDAPPLPGLTAPGRAPPP
eukprot:SAG22_NODE_11131_length_499_cov_0.837500_1_plen_47_part_01